MNSENQIIKEFEEVILSYVGVNKFARTSNYTVEIKKKYNEETRVFEPVYKASVTYYDRYEIQYNTDFYIIHSLESDNLYFCLLTLKPKIEAELQVMLLKRKLEAKLGKVKDKLDLLKLQLNEALEKEDYREAERIKQQLQKLINS